MIFISTNPNGVITLSNKPNNAKMRSAANRDRSRENDPKQERKVRFASDGDEMLDIITEPSPAKKPKPADKKPAKLDQHPGKKAAVQQTMPTKKTAKKDAAEQKPKREKSSSKKNSVRERKWDDFKDQDPSSLKTGLFSAEELALLQKSIVDYSVENDLTEADLSELLSKSCGDKFKKAWVEIAQVLPDRKVQSCMAVCRRKFNPNNYKGKWSQEEEDYLLEFVESKGRHWEEIAKELGRTALNVRDKYKELGEGNHKYLSRAK